MSLLGIVPDRIGHGTCLQPDAGGTKDIVDFVSSHKIPLGNKAVQTLSCYGSIYSTLNIQNKMRFNNTIIIQCTSTLISGKLSLLISC